MKINDKVLGLNVSLDAQDQAQLHGVGGTL